MELRQVVFKVRELKWKEVNGFFHCWGYDSTEGDDGRYVQWSIGICEDLEGNVHNVLPGNIKFIR